MQRCNGFLEANDADHSMALLVQLSKALLQSALDGGSWETAKKLIPMKDPLTREEFGGDEDELHCIQVYDEAVKGLRRNRKDPKGEGKGKDKGKSEP